MVKKTFIISLLAILVFCLGFGLFNWTNASETNPQTLTAGIASGVGGMEGVVKAAPTASPAAGTYHATQSVTLSASGSSAICYTANGDTPACASATTCTTGIKYSSAISVTSTATIKSIACYADASAGPFNSSGDIYTLTCSTASVSNGSVSDYPGCAISCNSGYTLSGSSCVASGSGGIPGGGGGGGGSYTPPVITSATSIISSESGGTVIFSGAGGFEVHVIVPPHATVADTTVSINTVTSGSGSSYTPPAATTGLFMIGNTIYQVTAVSGSTNITNFNQPITLKFHYFDNQIPSGVAESSLQIYYFDANNSSWIAVPSTLDTVNNLVTASVDHLTKFAVLGKKTEIATEITAITAPAIVSVSAVFSANLNTGMTSSDVKRLQQLLNSDPDTRVAVSGIGSSGNETNYFGLLTQKAVQKFQCKYNIVCLGTPQTTGYGNLGPKTRAKIRAVFEKVAETISLPSAPVAAPASETQAQIKSLQEQIQALQVLLLQAQIKLLQENIGAASAR